jgi:mannose-6-phosphate isomerase
MLYPVLFKPIYKQMLWGGTRLRTVYSRDVPNDNTGESWDISCRPGEMGIIENGPDAGLSFADYITRDRKAVMGTRLAEKNGAFPLLVKIIDANNNLSVQVHPDDGYALSMELSDTGKNEMWYIMEAPADGRLIIGLKHGVTRTDLLTAHEKGNVQDCLHHLPVKAGDMVNIPAGLIHAITKGTVIAEIQQNSDITYRLYDYDRIGEDGKPRTLHIRESLDAIDFSGRIPLRTVQGVHEIKNGNEIIHAIRNKYFSVSQYILRKPLQEAANPEAFLTFTNVAGKCRIISQRYTVDVPLSRSVFIPAGLGTYEIRGECTLLKTYVP